MSIRARHVKNFTQGVLQTKHKGATMATGTKRNEHNVTVISTKDSTKQKEKEQKINKMANLEFMKLSTVQLAGRGSEGSTSVSVGENGQIRFSSNISKYIRDNNFQFAGITNTDNGNDFTIGIHLLKALPKGFTEADIPKLHWPTKEDAKNKMVYFSGLRIARMLGYDVKASGNQSFDAELNEKAGLVTFTLPKGSVAPKPRRVRKPKAAPANGGTQAEVGQATAAGAGNGSGIDMSAPE